MMSPARLAAWLKQVPRNVETYTITLLPQDEDPAKEKVISTYPAFGSNEKTHLEFASEVLGEIQSHCDNNNIVCRYEVRAIAKKEILTSRIVRCTPTPTDQILASDPLDINPNQNPISANTATQQLVRTIEALLRTNVQSFGMIQNAWKDVLEIQSQQIDALLKREAQLADSVLVEIAKQGDLEEHELRKSQAFNKLSDMAEKYLPLIVQNLVGDEEVEN